MVVGSAVGSAAVETALNVIPQALSVIVLAVLVDGLGSLFPDGILNLKRELLLVYLPAHQYSHITSFQASLKLIVGPYDAFSLHHKKPACLFLCTSKTDLH